MKNIRIIVLILTAALFMLALPSCQVGSDSYEEPWEIDENFKFGVVYDAMGGTINTLPKREVYYSGGSLLKQPQGSTGMLIRPIYDNMVVLAWYTDYENVGTEEEPVYKFNEEDLWDFESDKISEENTDENKQLTLYARWSEPPTIFFVDADDTDNVLLKWENVDIKKKMTCPTTTEKAVIEKTDGDKTAKYSLLDYYFDPECTKKVVWGNESKTIDEIITEQDNPLIYVYCKYIEGEYKRIKSEYDLKKIKDMNGKYILASDIDLENKDWKAIKGEEPFSGVLLGNGYTISNLNIDATNRVSKLAAITAEEKSYGLFSELSGATFNGVNLKNVTVTVGSGSNVELCAGAFGGRAAKTVFENCSIQDYKAVSDGDVKVKVHLGTEAFTDESCTEKNCSFVKPQLTDLAIDDNNLIIGE